MSNENSITGSGSVSSLSNTQSQPTSDQQGAAPASATWDGKTVSPSQPPSINQATKTEVKSSSNTNLNIETVTVQPPPHLLAGQARHAALPDSEQLIKNLGQPPKKDPLFGLIKMSTNYKNILSQLDQVKQSLESPQDKTTIRQQLLCTENTLRKLDQAVDHYIAGSGSGKRRFKEEMRELKTTIGQEIKTLNRLKNSDLGKSWPPDLSLKDALDYGREGIHLDDVKYFKGQQLTPAEARKSVLQEQQMIQKERNREVIQGIKDAFKKKENAESFEKGISQVLDDGKTLRSDLRKQDKLTENDDGKIQKLMVQAEFATKAYVDLFIRDDALPKEMQELSHAALENQLGQLPMAKLSQADRERATQLLDLIHENTSLVHLKYQDFDKRFAMPEYATKVFGHQEGRQYDTVVIDTASINYDASKIANILGIKYDSFDLLKSIEQDEKIKDLIKSDDSIGLRLDFKNNQNKAMDFISDLLTSLIPKESAENIKNIKTVISHFDGLLRDRPDARIALSLLDASDRQAIFKQTVDRFSLLDKHQKQDLLSQIKDLTGQYLPDEENLKLGASLGEGISGIVYDGTFNGKPVVVKVLKPSNYSSYIIESLRQAELRDSPYTPKITGFMSKSDMSQARIILEKVDGNSYEKLKYPETMEDRAKVGIHCISGALKGLEFLHQRDLVHCDLKLANIMLDSKMLEPRVIDFGVCMKKGEVDRIGTPETMAPEVNTGKRPEPASDIYSLGCILYEQITKTPAQDKTEGLTKQTDFSGKEWKEAPLNECQVFIEACMREDPKQRPTTGQILQALRGDPVSPASPGEHGLNKDELGVLDLFKPENGYSLQAKALLSKLQQ
jgi:tRNA A-37 threonylcarbamoyl transferase component Bud32